MWPRLFLFKAIDEFNLARQDLRSCDLQAEPFGTVYLRKGLAPAAVGRPIDLEGIAGQRRRIEIGFPAEGDHALAAALADLSQGLQRGDRRRGTSSANSPPALSSASLSAPIS